MAKYIIIEGVDKSGKTTLINDPKVQEVLKQKGYKVMYLPHGWFRKIIKPLQKLIGFGHPFIRWLYEKYHCYLAKKFGQLADKNINLITDRSIVSTIVYQLPGVFKALEKHGLSKDPTKISGLSLGDLRSGKASNKLDVMTNFSLSMCFLVKALEGLGFDEVHIVYLYPIDKMKDLPPIRKELHHRYMTIFKSIQSLFSDNSKVKIHILRTKDRDKRVKKLLSLL